MLYKAVMMKRWNGSAACHPPFVCLPYPLLFLSHNHNINQNPCVTIHPFLSLLPFDLFFSGYCDDLAKRRFECNFFLWFGSCSHAFVVLIDLRFFCLETIPRLRVRVPPLSRGNNFPSFCGCRHQHTYCSAENTLPRYVYASVGVRLCIILSRKT